MSNIVVNSLKKHVFLKKLQFVVYLFLQ